MKYEPKHLRDLATYYKGGHAYPYHTRAEAAEQLNAHADALEERGELIEALKAAMKIIGHPDDEFSKYANALLERIGE